MENGFSVLFQSIEIGSGKKKLKLKNRFFMSPMVTFMASSLGEVTQRMVDYYVERAKGGVGTIIVESMNIDGKIAFNRLGIFHDRFINELEYLASSIKEHGARAFGQINQPGIRGNLPGPDDLSEKEIAELIEAYGAAAERLKRAEFDGVEIHGAHGYLINQFLSPPTNHRKDRYGGDPHRRTRFAQEVIRAVRQAVGEGFPISFRMNGDDYIEGGVGIDDAKCTALKAQEAGADVIHVSGGVGIVAHDLSLGDNKSYGYLIQPMALPRGCLVHLAAAVKKVVKVPVVTVGRINDPYLARDIITNGKADLIAMGRQLIADPYFIKKVSEGRIEDIRQCIACMYCHGKRMRATKRLHCAINPWAGRETELKDIRPADVSKDVMIIGGGPGGMEAARWLSKRGHRPSIYEKDDRLGGQLLLSCLPPHKEEVNRFREFLVKQVGKMGIEINLMTEVTPEYVLKKKPEVLIIATGAKQVEPDMPIDKHMRCVYAWDVISGKEGISGQEVVVLGGGHVAAEIADFIAEKGKHVTIVEMRDKIAPEMEPISRQMLIARLEKRKVKMITKSLVQEVTAKGVKIKGLEAKKRKALPAETVVVALGAEPVEFDVDQIRKAGIEVYFIGDAKAVNETAQATRDGFVVGISI